MKIAISGSACIGKTTLAKQIADTLGCAYIPEHYDVLFDEPKKFQSPPEVLVELFNTALSTKVTEERKHKAFISDRSPIDLFNLWMSRRLWKRGKDTSKFHKRCLHYASDYDYVVLLPRGVIPLTQMEGPRDGQRRIMNRWVQSHNHANIVGLTREWILPDKIVDIPKSAGSLNERANYLYKKIGHS